jgi:tetratricopeptide (TPR) repeat protein
MLQFQVTRQVPGKTKVEIEGDCSDNAMSAFLKSLALKNEGLCIITTRYDVAFLQGMSREAVMVQELEHLTGKAGLELLKDIGVKGTNRELMEVVMQMNGHVLSLKLFGNILIGYYDGEIKKKDRIGRLQDEFLDESRHATQLMESYHNLMSEVELALLYLVSVFDRPTPLHILDMMIDRNAAGEITARLNNVSERSLKQILKYLTKHELLILAPVQIDEEENEYNCLKGFGKYKNVDCHPLVRQYFHEQFRTHYPGSYQQTNLFLNQYFQQVPSKYYPDTIQELQPLLQAVAHGCLAGQYIEAMQIYNDRINRRDKIYTINELGAFGFNLSCLSYFFDQPWDEPAEKVPEDHRATLLGWAGFFLCEAGRLGESVQALKDSLRMRKKENNWISASVQAVNMAEAYLAAGKIPQAVQSGKEAVEYAIRSGNHHRIFMSRSTYAESLSKNGQPADAETEFKEAETVFMQSNPGYRFMYSNPGVQYCDFLLAEKRVDEVIERATETLAISQRNKWLRLMALDALNLGKACLLKEEMEPDSNKHWLALAGKYLNGAMAVMQKANSTHKMPLAFLTRAAWHCTMKEYSLAEADLKQAFEFAEYYNMYTWYVDYHMGKMKCYTSQGLQTEAATHWQQAKDWMEKTGYYQRAAEFSTANSI